MERCNGHCLLCLQAVSNKALYAFYGCDSAKDGDNIAQQQALQESANAFYADTTGDCQQVKRTNQSVD